MLQYNVKKYTIAQFRRQFPDENTCLQYVLDNRFYNICPHCYAVGTTFYKLTKRKAYSCLRCRAHIYPLSDTIFHKSRTSLWSWFYAIYLFSVSKNGVSAAELQRILGVTQKCAWRMAKHIRSLMYQEDTMFSGVVEADEMYYGGKNTPPKRYKNKVAVMGMVERGGKAKAVVTPARDHRIAMKFFGSQVAMGTEVVTDMAAIYSLHAHFDHKKVRHSPMTYNAGAPHTNTIEGMWSLLKSSLAGTYHNVSHKYLQYYVDEFVFHYNRDTLEVFNQLLDRAVQIDKDHLRKQLGKVIYKAGIHIDDVDLPCEIVALLLHMLPKEKKQRKDWLTDILNA